MISDIVRNSSTRPVPLTISGIVAWYDASVSSSLTFDGSDKISLWQDISGFSRHVSQGTGSLQPLYVRNAINGLPVVRTSATTYLTSSSLAATSVFGASGNAFTAVYAGKRFAETGRTMATLFAAANQRFEYDHDLPSSSTADGLLQTTTSAAFITSAPYIDTQSNIAVYTWNNGGSFDLTRRIASGTFSYSGGTVTGSFSSPVTIWFGTDNSTMRLAAPYEFGECIYYNRPLSLSEITILINYLSAKWAI